MVSDYGQFATVIDLDEWVTVVHLDRDWVDNELTRFPLAFLGEGETAKVVAATDWNRLDVFALPGGELLTDRDTPPNEPGRPVPEHYLDYFLGALHPSPSERWLVTPRPGAAPGCSPGPPGACGATAASCTSPPKPGSKSGTRPKAPESESSKASPPPPTATAPSPNSVTIG
ncbi:hypothetical protein [Amycolatopsis sp. NPDC003731]